MVDQVELEEVGYVSQLHLRVPFHEQHEYDADDYRTHFIDNLRTTLTILLIIQHSITETSATSTPHFHSQPFSIFLFVIKTITVGLFFFVSGYSASTSLSSIPFLKERSAREYVWRRTIRLFFPAVAYSVLGHSVIWMFLTKGWPSIFGSASVEDNNGKWDLPGFARLEGPVVHIFALYTIDMFYVIIHPSRTTDIASGRPHRSPRHQRRQSAGSHHPKRRTRFKIKVKSKQDWYILVGTGLSLISLWTFAVIAAGKSEKSLLRPAFRLASYDAIVPSAPFQHILSYMAGTRLRRWGKHMLISPGYILPAFFLTLGLSIPSLLLAMHLSPSFQEVVQLNPSSPIHPSFLDGGFNLHTLFFAIWNTLTFFGLASTIISVYAQWEWTKRDWGIVARHSYIPVWVHMIPVEIFAKLLGADGDWEPPLGRSGGMTWRCFLVATGSTICSWFVGLFFVGLGSVLGSD